MIGIGIDTGGTCTDAVVYDTVDHKVLSASKTLTTKQDLKKGIIKALEGLDIEKVRQAKYISLSTTLATNACVENKGGRAKLIFIGVNPKVVERMKGTYGCLLYTSSPAISILLSTGSTGAGVLPSPPTNPSIKVRSGLSMYNISASFSSM